MPVLKQAFGRKTRMGQVFVTLNVENGLDWAKAREAGHRHKKIRTVIVPDALVDTGATHLCLPRRHIRELGLIPYPLPVYSETANGVVARRIFRGALVTLEGRTEEFSVLELPDGLPALIGVIPLESLDLIVDPVEQKLIGKHGKKRVTLMY